MSVQEQPQMINDGEMPDVILKINDVTRTYFMGDQEVNALRGITLNINNT